MIKESKISKEIFLEWLNKYGTPVGIYNFDGYLSFDGSDGPKISDRGLKERKIVAHYDNPKEIDDYIKDVCTDSFGSPLKYPKISFEIYLKNTYNYDSSCNNFIQNK